MGKSQFSTTSNEAKKLSLLLKKGKVRRIHQGIYTDDFESPIEQIVKQHWMEIISFVVSKGILSFRSAVELRPIPFEKIKILFL